MISSNAVSRPRGGKRRHQKLLRSLKMPAQEIQDLSDLTREVQNLTSETHLEWLFRGHSDSSWDLFCGALPGGGRGWIWRLELRLFSFLSP